MQISVLTLFPEAFQPVLDASILRRAREAGLLQIDLVNFREFTHDRHRTVDDAPYGGGRGMLIKPEPVFEAMDWIRQNSPEKSPHVIMTCPRGVTFTQKRAEELALYQHLVLLCGHYEGFDQRIQDALVDETISVGDYVLTGGELPAMIVIDAVARLIPGVLTEGSAAEESFSDGLLEYPQYTRPPEFRGLMVPEILLSGDHGRIAKWRREQSLRLTLMHRPDLLEEAALTPEDLKMLKRIRRADADSCVLAD